MKKTTATKTNYSDYRSVLYLLFILLGMAVLNSVLIIIRAALTAPTAILVLYYACSLLSLFTTMTGVGAALFYLSRKMKGLACRLVWLTAGATLLPLLTAAIRTSIDYPNDLSAALTIEIFSALGNTLLMIAFHFLLLFFCWLFFFRRYKNITEAPRLSPSHNRLGLADLLVILTFFIYQITAKTIDTIDFINIYWPNIYQNEIASIIFEYIYTIISLLLGYLLQYGIQAALYDFYHKQPYLHDR